MKRRRLIPLLLCLTVMLSATGCASSIAKFNGSSTGNQNQFLLDFEVLNTTESNKMPFQAGEKVHAVFQIDKGRVDVIVKDEEGNIAYQGDDVESSDFLITIEKEGTYYFEVTGKKAKGSVKFVKEQIEENNSI